MELIIKATVPEKENPNTVILAVIDIIVDQILKTGLTYKSHIIGDDFSIDIDFPEKSKLIQAKNN